MLTNTPSITKSEYGAEGKEVVILVKEHHLEDRQRLTVASELGVTRVTP